MFFLCLYLLFIYFPFLALQLNATKKKQNLYGLITCGLHILQGIQSPSYNIILIMVCEPATFTLGLISKQSAYLRDYIFIVFPLLLTCQLVKCHFKQLLSCSSTKEETRKISLNKTHIQFHQLPLLLSLLFLQFRYSVRMLRIN